MRVLTVRQPWAWAIVHGGKDVENRSRNIAGDYRGPVAIHAAASKIALFNAAHGDLWPFNRAKHSLGAIIGVVDLWAAHVHRGWDEDNLCSQWAEAGAWHLRLRDPRPLADPIPFRGALGLRRLDAATIARIEEVA